MIFAFWLNQKRLSSLKNTLKIYIENDKANYKE